MLGNKAIMAKNIRYYMNKYNKTRNDICSDLGFKYSTFSDWINGYKYPRIDKIEMMANYFHISKSDLVEEHSDVSHAQRVLDPDQEELLADYDRLNADGKAAARERVHELTELPKFTKDTESRKLRTS